MFELFNNWNVIRWLGPPPWPYRREDAEAFLATVLPANAPDTYFLIEHEGETIGALSWSMQPVADKPGMERPYIGFWIAEPFWNRGFMTEAVAGAVDHLFMMSRIDAITSGVFEGNQPSLRVQRKLGFEIVGRRNQFCRPRNETLILVDTMLTRARHEAKRP